MSDLESEILRALRELDALAHAMPTAHPKPDLLPVFQRLDALAAQLPPDADSELRHFLLRKSYEKARVRLEGGELSTAPGACR